ncbi:hypothetical protein [Azospirillum sp.]|uniref:LuxE/PaaK family acyltransferase n=1 Tax=Azospirillum sp. TaxID=34012 RepID=UPI003D74E612
MDALPDTAWLAPFDTPPDEARARLLARLNALTRHHRAACQGYARILEAFGWGDAPADGLEAVPWLPVSLFKRRALVSVPADRIVAWLSSSGTDGVPSRVPLDRGTAQLQARALAALMRPLLGRGRAPLVVVDTATTLKRGGLVAARAAAIAGFGMMGRDPLFLLDGEGRPDWGALAAYRARHAGERLFIFGFTSMVWESLVESARRDGVVLDLSPALLLHGGGWKRLADRAVDAATFRAGLAERLNLTEVRNYYGLVEQVGTIFLECPAGRLHAPALADVLVRDPVTLAPLPAGRPGLLQLFSALPVSYPGHSLLTGDMGTVLGADGCPCGWRGRHFVVHGRLPQVEMRGCSDVRPAA